MQIWGTEGTWGLKHRPQAFSVSVEIVVSKQRENCINEALSLCWGKSKSGLILLAEIFTVPEASFKGGQNYFIPATL